MKVLSHLFENNRQWAAGIQKADPEFFKRLLNQQTPQFLWIGCADSRVPANEIVGLMPGELFVHRNVANLVVHSDMNCLATIQYAVQALQVRHIIVCGHYGCGGVRAAMDRSPHGLVDNWLSHVRDLSRRRRAELEALADDEARIDRLCEMNVEEQVLNVGRTTPVQDAWAGGQKLFVHGWIYRLSDGLLRDMGLTISSDEDLRALEGG
jgi:carbonic anhydrase